MSEWNLFERIVLDDMRELNGPAQRVYVRRYSLGSGFFGSNRPMPGRFRRFFDKVPAEQNLTPYFTLCRRWQQLEDSEFMELDGEHYFGQSSRPRGRARLSLSLPARITSKTWYLYLSAHRGLLFGYTVLYHLTGDLEQPQILRKEFLSAS